MDSKEFAAVAKLVGRLHSVALTSRDRLKKLDASANELRVRRVIHGENVQDDLDRADFQADGETRTLRTIATELQKAWDAFIAAGNVIRDTQMAAEDVVIADLERQRAELDARIQAAKAKRNEIDAAGIMRGALTAAGVNEEFHRLLRTGDVLKWISERDLFRSGTSKTEWGLPA